MGLPHTGTAGLRAKMGPGFNRMNPVTIQQTTQGLLRYLQQQSPEQLAANGVIIGESNAAKLSLSRACFLAITSNRRQAPDCSA